LFYSLVQRSADCLMVRSLQTPLVLYRDNHSFIKVLCHIFHSGGLMSIPLTPNLKLILIVRVYCLVIFRLSIRSCPEPYEDE